MFKKIVIWSNSLSYSVQKKKISLFPQHRLEIKSSLGLCCGFTKSDKYMYVHLHAFALRRVDMAVNPPWLQIYWELIGRYNVVDVITHDTWCHLCTKHSLTLIITNLWITKHVKTMLPLCHLTQLVYSPPITLLYYKGIPKFIRKCSTTAAPTLYVVSQLYSWSLCSSLKYTDS